jgi:hypothetical protein
MSLLNLNFDEMSQEEIFNVVDKQRFVKIKTHEYIRYDIPVEYKIIDFHNSYDIYVYIGIQNCSKIETNDFIFIDSFISRLTIYYQSVFNEYNNNYDLILNTLSYLEALTKLKIFVEEKRKQVDKRKQIQVEEEQIQVKKRKQRQIEEERKLELPLYLYPLLKLYNDHYNTYFIESIGRFSIFLAELMEEIKYYKLIISTEEKSSLNTIINASQNFKYSSFTKKSLSFRFYEFLCSIPELKKIERNKDLLLQR